MGKELKPVPDSTHMYLNPCGNITGHLFTLAPCTGGGGGGGVVMRHPHPQGWRVAKCFAGFLQRPRWAGNRLQEWRRGSCWSCPALAWHRAAELMAETMQIEVHDLEGPLQSQRDSTFQIATALNEQNPHPLWQAKDRKGWLQKKLKSSQPNCWFFFLVTSRVFYYQVWFHPCKQGQNPAPHSLQMKTFYYQAGLWTYISQFHCLEFHFERQIFMCAWLTGFAFFRTERPRMERK